MDLNLPKFNSDEILMAFYYGDCCVPAVSPYIIKKAYLNKMVNYNCPLWEGVLGC